MRFAFTIIGLLLLQMTLWGQRKETKTFKLGRTTFSCEYKKGRPINGYPEEMVRERGIYQIYPKYENGQPNGDSLRYLEHYEVMEFRDGLMYEGCTPSVLYGPQRNTDFYEQGQLVRTQYMEDYRGLPLGIVMHYEGNRATVMHWEDTIGHIVYTKKYTDGLLYFKGAPTDEPAVMKGNALVAGSVPCRTFDIADIYNIDDEIDWDQCFLTAHNDTLATVTCRNEGSPFYLEYIVAGMPYRISVPSGQLTRSAGIDWYFGDNHDYFSSAAMATNDWQTLSKASLNAPRLPTADGFELHYKSVETDELITVMKILDGGYDDISGIRLKIIDGQLYVIDLDDDQKVACEWQDVKDVVATLKAN